MIWNAIYRRKRKYRWKSINAILKPTSHDNEFADSDQAMEDDNEGSCQEMKNISVYKAIEWGQNIGYPFTLYIYDEGAGIE